jgi:DNA-binding transcriptional MerR regulator
MIRLLWIRKMADAGIALDDIRDAFADTAPTAADSDHVVAGILERLERTLGAQEAELQRQRVAVQRTRTGGSRMGLLSDLVASRLTCLPEGSLRQADLDNLLFIERIFGPLGAAVNATRYIVLATHPGLREECSGLGRETMSAVEAVGKMPYEFSPGPPAVHGIGRRTRRPGVPRLVNSPPTT